MMDMGQIYEVLCQNCGYKTVLNIGIGLAPLFSDVKLAPKMLPYKKRKAAYEILEKYTDLQVECFNNIFQCNKCNHLFSKLYLALFSGQDKVYETKFACPECRTRNIRMLERDVIESFEDENCPKCQKKPLNKTIMVYWD